MKRFPGWNQIIPVYSVGLTLLFSWTIIQAFQMYAVNWVLQFDVFETLSLFAYVIVGIFFESLLLIASLLIISFILPQKWFSDKFALYGTILTITFLGSIMYLYELTFSFGILTFLSKWMILFAVTTILLMVAGAKNIKVKIFFESLADRCTVFLYIYLPLSFVSLLVVLIRNIS